MKFSVLKCAHLTRKKQKVVGTVGTMGTNDRKALITLGFLCSHFSVINGNKWEQIKKR